MLARLKTDMPRFHHEANRGIYSDLVSGQLPRRDVWVEIKLGTRRNINKSNSMCLVLTDIFYLEVVVIVRKQ